MAKKKKRRTARRIGRGLKARGMAVIKGGAVGAAVGELEDLVAENVDFVSNRWYGGPLLLAGGALLIPPRFSAFSHALAGAAGYAARFNYRLRQFQLGERESSPVRILTQPDEAETKGVAALQQPRQVFDDAAALQDAYEQ